MPTTDTRLIHTSRGPMTFEVYRSETNPRGNAAVSIGGNYLHVPKALAKELTDLARPLGVRKLIVWNDDRVIGQFPLD